VGIQRARRYWEYCTYFGALPVSLSDYIASVHAQSVRKQNPRLREIQRVLDDLSVPQEMITRLAQAVNSGLGLFLFGAPGNGKTLIACRLAVTVHGAGKETGVVFEGASFLAKRTSPKPFQAVNACWLSGSYRCSLSCPQRNSPSVARDIPLQMTNRLGGIIILASR